MEIKCVTGMCICYRISGCGKKITSGCKPCIYGSYRSSSHRPLILNSSDNLGCKRQNRFPSTDPNTVPDLSFFPASIWMPCALFTPNFRYKIWGWIIAFHIYMKLWSCASYWFVSPVQFDLLSLSRFGERPIYCADCRESLAVSS